MNQNMEGDHTYSKSMLEEYQGTSNSRDHNYALKQGSTEPEFFIEQQYADGIAYMCNKESAIQHKLETIRAILGNYNMQVNQAKTTINHKEGWNGVLEGL